jgi:hypothetical protein
MSSELLKTLEGYAKELLLDTRLVDDDWVQIRLPDTYASIGIVPMTTEVSYPDFVQPVTEWVLVTFVCAIFPDKLKSKDWDQLAKGAATMSRLTFDIWLDEEYPKDLKLKFALPVATLQKNIFQVYLLEAIHNARELSRLAQRAYKVVSPTEILEYVEAKQKEAAASKA